MIPVATEKQPADLSVEESAAKAEAKVAKIAKENANDMESTAGIFLSINSFDQYFEGEQTSWVRANHTATLMANTIGEQSLCSGKMDVDAFWGDCPVCLISKFLTQNRKTHRKVMFYINSFVVVS